MHHRYTSKVLSFALFAFTGHALAQLGDGTESSGAPVTGGAAEAGAVETQTGAAQPTAPVGVPSTSSQVVPTPNSASAPASMGSIAAPAPTPVTDPGPPALLSGKHLPLGGYGGLAVVGSSMKGKGVVYVGAEGALLVDHRLAIGLAGYGLASHIAGPDDIYGEPQRLSFGYGGLLLRYHFLDRRPYYFSVGTLLGGGAVAYNPDFNRDSARPKHDMHPDAVFVAEPSVGGHLNLTRWARVGVQVSYRFVSGINELSGIREKDLAGFGYGGNIQFGEF